MNGVTVEMQRVHRSFGARQVLTGLNFGVASNEFVAVVGRSGSGKSTLLRLLAGLDQPDAGDIRVNDATLVGPNPSTRVVFQDGRLLPWLRVAENIALGRSRSECERVGELLTRVGLADRGRDWPAVLSGGQRQRVALARALASNPGLLLLDEPLGSLDALTRIEMQRVLEAVWLEARFTAVLITHDVEEAVTLADRVCLLDNGHIANEWSVPFSRPRSKLMIAELAERILEHLLGATSSISTPK